MYFTCVFIYLHTVQLAEVGYCFQYTYYRLCVQQIKFGLVVVVNAFNPNTQEAVSRWITQFQASLVYRVSSRTQSCQNKNKNKISGGELSMID